MTDTTKRECTHPRVRHQHGDRTTYVRDHCRCEECRTANHEYEIERRRRKAVEAWHPDRSVWVDAEPVRKHIYALMDAGMGIQTIRAAADLGGGQMTALLYGRSTRPPQKRIRRDVAEKLLTLRLELADGAQIPAHGTRRRLQALVALGWAQAELARRLGVTTLTVNRIVNGAPMTTEGTRKAVVTLYDELWDTAPPRATWHQKTTASRAVNHARAHGWAPPMAWDDDTIDNPRARPSGWLREAS